jgi:hypothetical protein
LVAGKFESAREMLSTALQREWTADRLQSEYEQMIEYGSGAPDFLKVTHQMDAWPDKQPDDLGWVYVTIGGSDYMEAVTVIVAREGDRAVIRELEWGRP